MFSDIFDTLKILKYFLKMDPFSAELLGVSKKNKSLADAFKELELVQEAFQRSSRIENKILKNESAISYLQSRMELLSTYSYVNTQTEKLQSLIDTSVKAKFDEYTSHILFEISRKSNETDLKKSLETKVNWQPFNEIKNSYCLSKVKLDSFIALEFPSYKSKIEDEFRKQRDENFLYREEINTQLEQLKQKYLELEEKVEEVLVDEESEKELHSEEDFEDMMSQLEKNILSESPRPPGIKKQEKYEKHEKNEKKDGFKADNKIVLIQNEKNSTFKNNTKRPNLKIEKTPLVGFVQQEKEEKTSTDFYGECYSPSYRKSNQEPYSRRNSVISSTGGGGGIKQLIKKVAAIEKDMVDIYSEINSAKKIFKSIEEEFRNFNTKIEGLNKRCDGIEAFEKKMEYNFVHMLRTKDMQNQMKKDKVLIERIPGEEITKLNKEISEKNKKIVQIDNLLKYLVTEIDYLKTHSNTKLKEVQDSLNTLEKDKKTQEKEFKTLKNNFSYIESSMSENINSDNKTRKVFSANQNDKEKYQSRRKSSQEYQKSIKEDLYKSLNFAEKHLKNPRVKSSTPKVWNSQKFEIV